MSMNGSWKLLLTVEALRGDELAGKDDYWSELEWIGWTMNGLCTSLN